MQGSHICDGHTSVLGAQFPGSPRGGQSTLLPTTPLAQPIYKHLAEMAAIASSARLSAAAPRVARKAAVTGAHPLPSTVARCWATGVAHNLLLPYIAASQASAARWRARLCACVPGAEDEDRKVTSPAMPACSDVCWPQPQMGCQCDVHCSLPALLPAAPRRRSLRASLLAPSRSWPTPWLPRLQ